MSKRTTAPIRFFQVLPGCGYFVSNLDKERAVEIGASGYRLCKIMPGETYWLHSALEDNWTAKVLRKPRRKKK